MRIQRDNKRFHFFLVSVLVVALVGGLALGALAAEEDQGTSGFKEKWMTIWEVLNFLILAFFVVKLLKEPLMRFFQQHSGMIREQFEGAEEASVQAERELQEVEHRFEALDGEIRELQGAISEQGARERDKVIASARQTADHMLQKARLESTMMVADAKRQLRAQVVDEAVRLAKERIETAIDSADQERLVAEYLQNLEQIPTTPR